MIKPGLIIKAEGFFPSERRWLFYRRYLHANEHKGDFIIIHGALEHSGRYEELATILAKYGYHVYMLDLTGYGRSEGKRGHIHKFDDYLIDLLNFYAFLQMHKNMQIPFLFGHSMGGLLATLFSVWGKCQVRGLILSAPLFGLKKKISFFKKIFIHCASLCYSNLTLPTPIDPPLLTHDEQIVEEYITDPFVQNEINGHWLLQMLNTLKKVHLAASYIKIPCLIFHGDQDAITDPKATQQFFFQYS